METSYGTQIVERLDEITTLINAMEVTERQQTMQLDVLMRLDSIISAIAGGDIGGGGGNPGGDGGDGGIISPVKTIVLSPDTSNIRDLDTDNGWIYRITQASVMSISTGLNLSAIDFSFSQEIFVIIDNLSATSNMDVLINGSGFIFMNGDTFSIPAGASAEISFVNIGDGNIRTIFKVKQ